MIRVLCIPKSLVRKVRLSFQLLYILQPFIHLLKGGSVEPGAKANQEQGFGLHPQKLTGWAAVEKTLTDFDQKEVSGYKEDIDSLLTFVCNLPTCHDDDTDPTYLRLGWLIFWRSDGLRDRVIRAIARGRRDREPESAEVDR